MIGKVRTSSRNFFILIISSYHSAEISQISSQTVGKAQAPALLIGLPPSVIMASLSSSRGVVIKVGSWKTPSIQLMCADSSNIETKSSRSRSCFRDYINIRYDGREVPEKIEML